MSANLFRKYIDAIPKPVMMKLFNLWRPYRGAGIRLTKVSDDQLYIRVEMPLTWYNKNYVGTQFGGSLYAMTDPFYMFQLLQALGKDYIVWDKAASIDFKRPGRGLVYAEFQWTQGEISDVKSKADELGKYVFDKPVEIKDLEGNVIAEVIKTLYVRRKDAKRPT